MSFGQAKLIFGRHIAGVQLASVRNGLCADNVAVGIIHGYRMHGCGPTGVDSNVLRGHGFAAEVIGLSTRRIGVPAVEDIALFTGGRRGEPIFTGA